jgi:hypothetical protein
MNNQITIFLVFVFFVVLISIQYTLNKMLLVLKDILNVLKSKNIHLK